MFDGIGEFIKLLIIVCCISVPLGIWKLMDIIVWVFKHVNVGIN